VKSRKTSGVTRKTLVELRESSYQNHLGFHKVLSAIENWAWAKGGEGW